MENSRYLPQDVVDNQGNSGKSRRVRRGLGLTAAVSGLGLAATAFAPIHTSTPDIALNLRNPAVTDTQSGKPVIILSKESDPIHESNKALVTRDAQRKAEKILGIIGFANMGDITIDGDRINVSYAINVPMDPKAEAAPGEEDIKMSFTIPNNADLDPSMVTKIAISSIENPKDPSKEGRVVVYYLQKNENGDWIGNVEKGHGEAIMRQHVDTSNAMTVNAVYDAASKRAEDILDLFPQLQYTTASNITSPTAALPVGLKIPNLTSLPQKKAA